MQTRFLSYFLGVNSKFSFLSIGKYREIIAVQIKTELAIVFERSIISVQKKETRFNIVATTGKSAMKARLKGNGFTLVLPCVNIEEWKRR